MASLDLWIPSQIKQDKDFIDYGIHWFEGVISQQVHDICKSHNQERNMFHKTKTLKLEEFNEEKSS